MQSDNGEPFVDRTYYLNRQLRSEGVREKCLREGHWKFWNPEGWLSSEGEYKNDKKEGPWKFWFPNGQLRSEGEFKDGERTGHWKEWFDNGQLQSEGEYKDGNREGIWKEWKEDGTPQPDILWKDGEEATSEAEIILRETTHSCIIYKKIPDSNTKYKLCTFSEEHVHDYEFLESQPTPVTKCYYCQHPLGDAVYQQP
jgi:hypothetical protein